VKEREKKRTGLSSARAKKGWKTQQESALIASTASAPTTDNYWIPPDRRGANWKPHCEQWKSRKPKSRESREEWTTWRRRLILLLLSGSNNNKTIEESTSYPWASVLPSIDWRHCIEKTGSTGCEPEQWILWETSRSRKHRRYYYRKSCRLYRQITNYGHLNQAEPTKTLTFWFTETGWIDLLNRIDRLNYWTGSTEQEAVTYYWIDRLPTTSDRHYLLRFYYVRTPNRLLLAIDLSTETIYCRFESTYYHRGSQRGSPKPIPKQKPIELQLQPNRISPW
jgi:hypothetical protein